MKVNMNGSQSATEFTRTVDLCTSGGDWGQWRERRGVCIWDGLPRRSRSPPAPEARSGTVDPIQPRQCEAVLLPTVVTSSPGPRHPGHLITLEAAADVVLHRREFRAEGEGPGLGYGKHAATLLVGSCGRASDSPGHRSRWGSLRLGRRSADVCTGSVTNES